MFCSGCLLTQRLLWHSFEGGCGKVERGVRLKVRAVNSPFLRDRRSPLCVAGQLARGEETADWAAQPGFVTLLKLDQNVSICLK